MHSVRLYLILSVVLAATGCKQNSKTIEVSDVFRDQLMKYLEASGELEAASDQGVNTETLKAHLAKVKSLFELVSATWPDGFQPDAQLSFHKAIKGWDLAVQLSADFSEHHRAPTEPNINGYDEYMAYAGDSLKTNKWSVLHEELEGKKFIDTGDENVGILLTLAYNHSKVGKRSVLAALSQN